MNSILTLFIYEKEFEDSKIIEKALIISEICLSDGSGSPGNLLLSAAMARRLLHKAKDPAAIFKMQDAAALGNKTRAKAESAAPP